MGADKNQLLKAMQEAEAYNGPSLIIAYAPCINHGINMRFSQDAMKKAAAAGTGRSTATIRRQGRGQAVLTWESKEPSIPFKDYILAERALHHA